jgi:YbbR domain-containing protein
LNWRNLFAKIVRNWPAKILSLALAIILFTFHRISILETRFFSTPIIIENLNGMMPAGQYPRMIRVSVRGESNSVYSILEDDIETYVDMSRINTRGTYVVPVQWRKRSAVQGAQPIQISVEPIQITLAVDYRISKLVPVTASFRGQVETGYNMTSFSLNPSQVIIDGPAELMGGVSELHTEFIDLGGRRNNFSITAHILQSDPLIIIRGNGTTEFNGLISQIIPARNILNVPITITGIREGFTAELEIQTTSVHLEGDNLDEVNRFILPPEFLIVDCSGISEPGTYVLRVQTGTAENISFRPELMEVTVRIVLEEGEEP